MSSKNVEEIVHRSYTSKPKYTELLPGVPEDHKQIKTLEDLLNINYKHVSVGEQMRRLLRLLGALTAEEMRNRVEFLSAWT